MAQAFEVQTMSAADLARALDWAAAEGWNPGLDDARAFQIADPQGFLVGLLDGVSAACVSVVRYGPDFGFLGFYLATPATRGRGYGLRIWNAGMARLAGRTIGLDGVPAQQDNYRKSGFKLAWRNIRYQGPAAVRGLVPPDVTVVDAKTLPFDVLAAYDRRFFPAPRDAFLANWIGGPGHIALTVIRDGAIAGLGVIRPCREGFKIGPLYAVDATIAAALISGLCECVGPGVVALDVPESNAPAVSLAESLGLVPAFETARMYTGATPDIDDAGLFGVTTFELG